MEHANAYRQASHPKQAPTDSLAVREPPVVRCLFERMTECMSQVQHQSQFRFVLIARDHVHFDFDSTRQHRFERGGISGSERFKASLKLAEQGRSVQYSMLHHFVETR